MLLSLRIHNFTLIDELELEFGAGLNVLTGETGAGKSIVLDAIDLVLGGKATPRMIRTGTEKATIEGTFDLTDRVRQWSIAREFDVADDILICSRELSFSGPNLRSRMRVNGAICNRQLGQELRELLIEITAQGQTVQLTNTTHQRELLDLYGGTILIQHRESIAAAYTAYQQADRMWLDRQQNEQQRLQRLDLLEYQARELAEVNLTTPDELIDLETERQRLSHVVDLQQQSYAVYQLLYQNDTGGSIAVADLLGKAESTLIDMVDIDSSLQSTLDLVSLALAQVTEAGREINYYGDALEADPDRLVEIEERIRTLKLICRKYGPSLTDAIDHQLSIQTELTQLTGAGVSLEELLQQATDLQTKLVKACQKLTTLRQQAAIDLEQHLICELKPLAMDKVQFQVEIVPQTPTSIGADSITFYFSPNPGEPLQPLAATASGGEMSRFLLALKACFSHHGGVGTLIFDEIDAGVSGKVAQSIASKLHHLSQSQQVLCVTHQPLIAAMADRHFRVVKETIDRDTTKNGNAKAIERTIVRIEELHSQQQRRDEIAQIAGGQSAQEAISFATSLLSQAKTRKKAVKQSRK
ncbi:DNA repair protein RecN [Chamaesiphon sp. VAR_48_metabat_135_sub]|uniref:DNA repair protein RecN n=1 Tax=Chamaesiphon sp. VAR_48_metabat_135_sub TaxID=2964699 RepID=UPI00286CED97|nr:DNA repair protein RecN [Chamaesiphon sp. VAR_48_metabat_135_sub]